MADKVEFLKIEIGGGGIVTRSQKFYDFDLIENKKPTSGFGISVGYMFRPNIDNVNLRKRAVRSQEELRYANFDGNTTLFSIRSIARSDYTFTTPRKVIFSAKNLDRGKNN